MTTPHLDLYDMAWLAGGRRRASQTAVAALVGSGRVKVTDPTADLQAVGGGATHPVETAVLDALGTRGHRGIETVVFLVREDPRLDAVEERLVRAGLLRRGRLASAVRSPLTRAGRRALRALREHADARPGSVATAEVALHGLVRVPAGLPAALAERPPSHWSFTRREPVDSDRARIHAGNFIGPVF
ncbi:TIGR04222 domain-containing membrane protein [Blastococcus sp. PRF04-17]|uniref:TIGR04222 domain-containing membrane protein n=1 Tax=Blastococcus sp. PRF04-17 TaxID=2933797 RepID=UPI001FF59BA2|nr:TIGR04222 domain-containing membrane protein [Blastococcus sp. PRF04-17]UOY03867.1 TIGR04222 domain-containing membrane protein [Blastococcus sp. PRF04-17]